MATISNRPAYAEVVTDYTTLNRYLAGFGQGAANLLLLLGDPGLGKSRLVKQAVPDARLLESHLTAFQLYVELYKHRNQVIVVDDVDNLYADKKCVSLIRSVTQTDPIKTVSWNSRAVAGAEVPQSFQTTSPVIVIANEWRTLNKNVAAIESRGLPIVFEPTAEEIHKYVSEYFWDQEVFDHVSAYAGVIPDFSCRLYRTAMDLKRIEELQPEFDWKRRFLARYVDPRTLSVACLASDPNYGSEKDRVAAFAALGDAIGGSRPTYFAIKKQLKKKRAEVALPHIKLKHTRPPDEVDDDEGEDILDRLRRRAGRG